MPSSTSIKNYLGARPDWPLAVLRIGVGIMFAIAATGKVSAGTGWPGRMAGFISFQAEKTPALYRAFLESVVIPNQSLFGYFVAYGEVLVAVSLILGLFSRWGAVLGLFLVANFWLAKGGVFWVPSANDPMYMLALFTLAFTQSGKVFGLDGRR